MKIYHKKYSISDTVKYVVDYVFNSEDSVDGYFQLVRVSDDAILFSASTQTLVIVHCWFLGISNLEVAFI